MDGSEVFHYLLKSIRPKILILFGKGTKEQFAKSMTAPPDKWKNLDNQLAEIFPEKNRVPKSNSLNDASEVFCIPGLVQAGWNEWSDWIDEYTDKLADTVAKRLV